MYSYLRWIHIRQIRTNAALVQMLKVKLSKTITRYRQQMSLLIRIHKVPCLSRRDWRRRQFLSSVEHTCSSKTRTRIERRLSFSYKRLIQSAFQGNSTGRITILQTLQTCISPPATIFFQSILESIHGTAPVDCTTRNIWCWLSPAGHRPSALSTGGFIHLRLSV